MEMYDIIKAEGGYRLVCGLWGTGYVIDASPWYPTLGAAQQERGRRIMQKKLTTERDAILSACDGSEVEARCVELYHKHQAIVAAAAPVAWDTDPE